MKPLSDQTHIQQNICVDLPAISAAALDILECFDCFIQVERLAKANLLWLVTEQFAHIDRYPLAVGNASRGLLVAELLCSARNCARSCSTPYRSARCGQVQPGHRVTGA